MKKLTALLLSFAGTATVATGPVQLGLSTDRPKEPPSTTLVVQGDSSLSEKTKDILEIKTVKVQSVSKPPQTVLTVKYKFNEKSSRVKKLQRVLGVLADGHYGKVTRLAHIAKLKAAGLSTSIVPAVTKPVPRYNISYDKDKRCPQHEQSFESYGLHPVDVFSYIAWRESRCNPDAVNAIWKNGKITWTLNRDGSYDSGLLQINSSWKTVTAEVCGAEYGNLKVLRTLDCNLKVAKYILENSTSGLGNWKVYRRS
jgi:hypothetical protein